MNKNNSLHIDDIIKRVKAEAKNKEVKYNQDINTSFRLKEDNSNILINNSKSFVNKDDYEYSDFTRYHDIEFISNIYKGLLLRDADKKGLSHYLNLLRSGKKSKSEIISIIRYSKEGRNKNVKLLGSKKRFMLAALFNLPIIGYMSKLLFSLLTLPRLVTRLNRCDNYIAQESNKSLHNDLLLEQAIQTKVDKEDIKHITSKLINQIDTKITKDEFDSLIEKIDLEIKNDLEHKVNNLVHQIDTKITKEEFDSLIEKIDLEIKNDLEHKINSLISEIDARATKDEFDGLMEKINLEIKNDIEQKVNNLIHQIDTKATKEDFKLYLQNINYANEYLKLSYDNIKKITRKAEKRLPKKVFNDNDLKSIVDNAKQNDFNKFYINFENRFRGTRDEIKERVKQYLKYVEKLPFKKEDMNILDIGCGRGEWLELIKENGYNNGIGIDINTLMVKESVKLGLNVKEIDAIKFLNSLKDNSIEVITSFHLVEHLPFDVLKEFLEEIFRVLKQNGLIILETPNPQNITVGACNFYMDPTHKNPIPSKSLEFLLKSVGFGNLKEHNVLILDEVNIENNPYLYEFINNWVNVSPDYAIIGYKL